MRLARAMTGNSRGSESRVGYALNVGLCGCNPMVPMGQLQMPSKDICRTGVHYNYRLDVQ